ncbi:hypothetical protein PF005_g18926 [Phytophthora fragariae]|uniref:Uncharacterized protein n=1 Tax=Phytophthora fragariae TaxID=53985 RepID=A0A6A3SMM7_9STRA|nr:hypothetical protein PF003_g35969 [Phytophthora fragariae]KAE8930017.1 hypothetical protein PF009_g19883 [Phytophthora fragariae]KAE8990715.1 hypothetical protein PF011_g18238 [Phytophthora fragariae]KAE9089960.1 hypothetical protein PF007_g19413 [Phytophthora fragariae]KAE9090264.1 hypothetical protein PF010_g18658 [Phytophthora fragariae]
MSTFFSLFKTCLELLYRARVVEDAVRVVLWGGLGIVGPQIVSFEAADQFFLCFLSMV